MTATNLDATGFAVFPLRHPDGRGRILERPGPTPVCLMEAGRREPGRYTPEMSRRARMREDLGSGCSGVFITRDGPNSMML